MHTIAKVLVEIYLVLSSYDWCQMNGVEDHAEEAFSRLVRGVRTSGARGGN